jgi:hypothetical protein
MRKGRKTKNIKNRINLGGGKKKMEGEIESILKQKKK